MILFPLLLWTLVRVRSESRHLGSTCSISLQYKWFFQWVFVFVTRIKCVLSLFKDLVHLLCLCDVLYKAPFTSCDDLCLTCLCQSIDMTAAIASLALNRHSSCFRLTDFVYKTLRNFRLLSSCPTRRSYRGGRTRRRWGNSLYLTLHWSTHAPSTARVNWSMTLYYHQA